MTKNLDELHSTNPKDFWKLLNKGKRKNQPDIGIDKLFDVFKDLNSLFSYNFFGRIYSPSQSMVYLKTVFPYGFYLNLNQGFQPDIGIDKLFDVFKDLNSDSEGNVYEGQLDMDEGTLEQINSHINLPITKSKSLSMPISD
jgi:hypothetical protein